MSDKIVSIEGQRIRLTNLEKKLYPNISKLDLINYYDSMSEYILPYLMDRPLSMQRFPDGIDREGLPAGKAGFFQKNIGELKLPWMKTKKIRDHDGEETEYLICDDKTTLIYLANLACLELNPWLSTTGHLDRPDFLLLDLDPEDIDFRRVIDVAKTALKVLDGLNIKVYLKTSGARGIHLFIFTGARRGRARSGAEPKYSYPQVRNFAQILAHLIHQEIPQITSLERSPQKRQKKVYLDFLQNSQGQTVVCPYSPRPKPGAPVSAPIDRSELTSSLSPDNFTIKNILERVNKKGDIFKSIFREKPVDIARILSQIKEN